jgi:fatty-acyl-CoA synthase
VIGDAAEGITHFFAVPAPYQFMLQHPEVRHHRPVAPALRRRGRRALRAAILQGWGRARRAR